MNTVAVSWCGHDLEVTAEFSRYRAATRLDPPEGGLEEINEVMIFRGQKSRKLTAEAVNSLCKDHQFYEEVEAAFREAAEDAKAEVAEMRAESRMEARMEDHD